MPTATELTSVGLQLRTVLQPVAERGTVRLGFRRVTDLRLPVGTPVRKLRPAWLLASSHAPATRHGLDLARRRLLATGARCTESHLPQLHEKVAACGTCDGPTLPELSGYQLPPCEVTHMAARLGAEEDAPHVVPGGDTRSGAYDKGVDAAFCHSAQLERGGTEGTELSPSQMTAGESRKRHHGSVELGATGHLQSPVVLP